MEPKSQTRQKTNKFNKISFTYIKLITKLKIITQEWSRSDIVRRGNRNFGHYGYIEMNSKKNFIRIAFGTMSFKITKYFQNTPDFNL